MERDRDIQRHTRETQGDSVTGTERNRRRETETFRDTGERDKDRRDSRDRKSERETQGDSVTETDGERQRQRDKKTE